MRSSWFTPSRGSGPILSFYCIILNGEPQFYRRNAQGSENYSQPVIDQTLTIFANHNYL